MSTQIDLGPVLSIPKGDWNADTAYERLNMVRHNSASWICNVATSKGVEPTEDSTDWYLQVKDTSSVTSVNGMKGDVVITLTETETPPANDDSNRIATTEWVTDKLGDVDLSGIKDDTVLAAQSASNLEVSKDTLSYAELIDYIARVERNVKLPLGFEYTRLTGETAPLGGVDYMGQMATRAMYIDLWMWLQEYKSDAIVSESEWQSLYSSQNGNVAKYSTGDGSTTFRFPRMVGYAKGAASASEIGGYTTEGLPNVTGYLPWEASDYTFEGAFYRNARTTVADKVGGKVSGYNSINFDASRSNSIYGNSDHVTPETVTVVMGVIAIGAVAEIGTATEAGLVAEVAEISGNVGALENGVGRASAYITETWRSGTEWYRKWSDGWIEQGGVTTTSTSATTTVVTLYKQMASSTYSVFSSKSDATDTLDVRAKPADKTISSVTFNTFSTYNNKITTGNVTFEWLVIGKGA